VSVSVSGRPGVGSRLDPAQLLAGLVPSPGTRSRMLGSPAAIDHSTSICAAVTSGISHGNFARATKRWDDLLKVSLSVGVISLV